MSRRLLAAKEREEHSAAKPQPSALPLLHQCEFSLSLTLTAASVIGFRNWRTIRRVAAACPNGASAYSPRLPRKRLPWVRRPHDILPQRGCAKESSQRGLNPVGVMPLLGHADPGVAPLARVNRGLEDSAPSGQGR